MPKKTIKINIDINYKIVGIISTEKDHKIAWLINKAVDISLKKTDIFIKIFPNSNVYFQNTDNTKILLIENNKYTKKTLNGVNDFDYILKIWKIENSISDFLKNIRTKSNINFIGVITADKLTKKTLNQVKMLHIE